jgi:hypothetical protein
MCLLSGRRARPVPAVRPGRTACCRLVRCRTPSLYLLVDVDKTLAGMITSGPVCHDRAETSLLPDIGMVAGVLRRALSQLVRLPQTTSTTLSHWRWPR